MIDLTTSLETLNNSKLTKTQIILIIIFILITYVIALQLFYIDNVYNLCYINT